MDDRPFRGCAMFADLHLHTSFSDGTYSPEELAAQAQRHGLGAIALTDHDSVEGCARAARACQAAGIEFIPGTELTAEQDGHELHFLGYFIETHNPRLLTEIARFQAVRQNRIREMVARLNRLKVPLAAERVFALANCSGPWSAARRPGAGPSRAVRQPGRGFRALPEEESAGVGSQVQDVGGRRHQPDSPRERIGGAGSPGVELVG